MTCGLTRDEDEKHYTRRAAVLTCAGRACCDCSCHSCWCTLCHCCPHWSWWSSCCCPEIRSHFCRDFLYLEMYSLQFGVQDFWNWFLMKLDFDESGFLMKVVFWWKWFGMKMDFDESGLDENGFDESGFWWKWFLMKVFFDESGFLMKVVWECFWWKWFLMKSDSFIQFWWNCT